eukprot:TRINITY_DN109467_c0_g1_i1.p1 TRINITY_DN109467_c0_g1~~TRINITY_DN109467_c0_g1_i1.p1  ORF type:complete len:661 (+),score=110.38 TRINITY_DN109467_c0_g1_i1:246-1985(+)
MAEEIECPEPQSLRLLSDEEVQRFIVEGFLELDLTEGSDGLDASFHQDIFDAASNIGLRQVGELGNNILPAMPSLAKVYNSPRCRGALTSLLGHEFMMHPHRFCHTTEPGTQAQCWHRDSFWGNQHARNNCPYWLMGLYFPQDTPVELGPTEIMPRSQYYNLDDGCNNNIFGTAGTLPNTDVVNGLPEDRWYFRQKPLSCKAGTVVLMHYDMWHRGGANFSADKVRYMFKFQFSRLVSPSRSLRPWTPSSLESPDWSKFLENTRDAADDVDTSKAANERESMRSVEIHLLPVWQGVWDWLCGCQPEPVPLEEKPDSSGMELKPEIEALVDALLLPSGNDEPRRVEAAWKLGRLVASESDSAALMFINELQQLSAVGLRWAMPALEAAGPSLIPNLLPLQAIKTSPSAVRALGRAWDSRNLGPEGQALEQQVIQVLRDLLLHSSPQEATAAESSSLAQFRQCAVEALGCIGHEKSSEILLHVVSQDMDGDVCATACHGILRLLAMGCLSQSSIDHVYIAMQRAQQEHDRYVAAYAAQAVHTIDHIRTIGRTSAEQVPYLIRWCSSGNGWMSLPSGWDVKS